MTASLASAFAADPVLCWMSGQADCQRRMGPFWRWTVDSTLRHADHLAFVTDDGASAAVWRGIDRWKIPPADIVRSLPSTLRSLRLGLVRSLGMLSAMEKAHPKEPHYYLEFLGTRADAQGRGGGSAVLAPMLERCDREGLPAYLESSNPRNIPFYARHGFVVRPPLDLPGGAPPMTPMWREPR